MAMRQPSGRNKRAATRISIREFGWSPWTIASLRHPTLPWFESRQCEIEIEGTPLSELRRFPARDALSLLGQYTAHQSFLRFASIDDGSFDPVEWMVVHRRGQDCRLVRIRSTPSVGSAPPRISLIEEFAGFVGIDDLETARQSWARPAQVYRELYQRLRHGAASDLRWVYAAAAGAIHSPGATLVEALFGDEPISFATTEPNAIETLRFAGDLARTELPLFVIGGAASSPIRRCSALSDLERAIGSMEGSDESEIAERFLETTARGAIVILDSPETHDRASRTVTRLLGQAPSRLRWIVPSGERELFAGARFENPSETRPFLLSPRLQPYRRFLETSALLDPAERIAWVESAVQSEQLSRYLDDGVIPDRSADRTIASIGEPIRSYLAALALLGDSTETSFARHFLDDLGCRIPVEELMIPGVLEKEGSALSFRNPAVRERLVAGIPADSLLALARLAAETLSDALPPRAAASLFVLAGEPDRGLATLENEPRIGQSPESQLEELASFPPALIRGSAVLSERIARALIACGRYRDAREWIDALQDESKALLTALVFRRLGEYTAALDALSAVAAASLPTELLRIELLRLLGRYDDALAGVRKLDVANADRSLRTRAAYEAAVLAIDRHEAPAEEWLEENDREGEYWRLRYRSYRAAGNGDHTSAARFASEARASSPDLPTEIDATIDLLWSVFLAGDWESARHDARKALALVEETQGDRAAGAVLFYLAWLCADAGQPVEAGQKLERLRRFYLETKDERRLRELDLISAQIAFVAGRHDDARQLAAEVWNESLPDEIREAAALILDEIDGIDGPDGEIRSSGESLCLELRDRHAILVARRGGRGRPVLPFNRALADWEASWIAGGRFDPPAGATATERLKLLRSFAAMNRRRPDARLGEAMSALRTDMHVAVLPADAPTASESELLRILSMREFPFAPDALGPIEWRYASRNRLGRWSEIGSLPPLEQDALDELLLDLPPGWHDCGDSGLLFIRGSELWRREHRDAVVALFTLRAEHHRLRRLNETSSQLIRDSVAPLSSREGIVGESPAIRELLSRTTSLARSDIAVCILGESGTGKELVARAIHRGSSRRNRPFTPVNCGALPENLVESELFGAAKGAFTGADRDRQGLIEVTDGGALFLDEVGELPLPAQAKLLRFLQEGEYRRVGETEVRHADVRIIAATNRILEQQVDSGQFREDLYYRIRGVELPVPPLRERGGDIMLLARSFLAAECEKQHRGPARFSSEVESVFIAFAWPGNVRELQGVVRSAHTLAGESAQIELEHLPERMRSAIVTQRPRGTFYDEVNRYRRHLIERSLLEANGNQSRAARLLGMSRQALAYQIRELGIMVK
ncbi:MAG: sigma 54-interacting transcriptional regulator [Thermoanaerobaculia bacterium]